MVVVVGQKEVKIHFYEFWTPFSTLHLATTYDSVHWLRRRTLVPVFRDRFLSAMVYEAAWLASDGEEGLENVSVQVASLVLLGAVGHEVDHEVVGVWSNQTGEGGGEVVARERGLVSDFLDEGLSDIRVVLDGVVGGVLGLRSSLVLSKTVLAEQAVEVLPLVHLKGSDVSVMKVSITL